MECVTADAVGYPYGMADQPSRRPSAVLVATRIVLPAVIFVVGLGLTVAGGSDALVGVGVALMGIAPLLVLLNLFMQLAVRSNRDRDREERAREYFDRHGRWPDPSGRS